MHQSVQSSSHNLFTMFIIQKILLTIKLENEVEEVEVMVTQLYKVLVIKTKY